MWPTRFSLTSSIFMFLFPFTAQASWEEFKIPQTGGTETVVDVSFINHNEGWFLISDGFDYEIYRTVDGAESISLESTGEDDINTGYTGARGRIHFRDGDTGYLLTNDLFNEVLYKTVDGGKSFVPMQTVFNRVFVLEPTLGNAFWIAGTGGPSSATSVVAYTPDGGITWEVPATPLVSSFGGIDMFFLDDQHGWLSGESGQMIYTQDGGQTWQVSRTGTTHQINAIRFSDPHNGWAVGFEGMILRSTDGGKTWVRQVSQTVENLYDLEVLDSERAFAVGGRIFSDGTYFHPSNLHFTRDGGANWFQENLPFTTTLHSIQVLGNDIWIGGGGGEFQGDMHVFHRTLTGYDSPVITLRPLPPGVQGFPYESPPIESRFGTPPYAWSLSAEGYSQLLPSGIAVNEQTGVLEGTPENSREYRFNVQVVDANGESDTAEFALRIASDPLSAGTDPLPPATHRKTFRAGIDIRGGNPPYDGQITFGNLPKGITLEPNLVLAGTPLETGEFVFGIQISDRSSPPQRQTFDLSLNVSPLMEGGWEVQHAHNRIMGIHFFDEKEGIAVGWSGILYRTLDGGRSWNTEPVGLSMISFTWVGNEGWMITDRGLFHSIDRGKTWENLEYPLLDLEGVHFLDSQRGWLYGSGIASTTDGGQQWKLASLPTPAYILSLDFADPWVGYAGANDALVFKTTDGGSNWMTVAVQGLNDGTKTLELGPERPLRSTVGCSIEREKGTENLPQVGKVEFIDSHRGWIGTNQFNQPYTSIFHTEDGGNTWTPQTVRGDGNISNITFLQDGLTGWASMLFDSGFFYTTNGGALWEKTSFEGGIDDVSFWAQEFLDEKRGFVAYNALGDTETISGNGLLYTGMEGSIWRTLDGGKTFDLVFGFPEDTNTVPNSRGSTRTQGPDIDQIQFFDELNGFAVGKPTDGSFVAHLLLYRTRNGGASWQYLDTVPVDRKILFVTPTHGWALDQDIGSPVFETRDGGLHFVPREDIQPDGTDSDSKTPNEKGFSQVTFSDIFFVDEQTGWIYINQGENYFYTSRLLRTQDGGSTWQKIYEVSQKAHKGIYFVDRSNGYLFNEYGRIERSRDGGETWTQEFSATQESPYPRFRDLHFGGAGQGWAVGTLGVAARTIAGSSWERVDFPESWDLRQTTYPLCSRGILVGAMDPVTGPPVFIDQADSIFDASQTVETGLLYHDLRTVDFASTVSGWVYGGFGAGMKYAAPTDVLMVATEHLPDGVLQAAYSQQLLASHGTGPQTWRSCQGNIPPGVSLLESGLLQGTPTQAGNFRFQVSISDGSEQEAARWLMLTIQPELRPTIVTDQLPDGTVGVPYGSALEASGSIEPYDWLMIEGNLPPGLTMAGSGLIGGVPTTPGMYSIKVAVFDAQNPAGGDEKRLEIEIDGRFAEANPDPCSENPLFCLSINWKESSAAGPSDFDGDGDSDALDILEVLKDRRDQ
jgi:photosystem II stability/assembly factor-like uncharacterized protein